MSKNLVLLGVTIILVAVIVIFKYVSITSDEEAKITTIADATISKEYDSASSTVINTTTNYGQELSLRSGICQFNIPNGKFQDIIFLKFDVSAYRNRNMHGVELHIYHQSGVQSEVGNPSKPTFPIYGLINEPANSWNETDPDGITWYNAPGIDHTISTFYNIISVISGDVTVLGVTSPTDQLFSGEIVFNSTELDNFINYDEDGIVTIIIARNPENPENGHNNGFEKRTMFLSKETGSPPYLLVHHEVANRLWTEVWDYINR